MQQSSSIKPNYYDISMSKSTSSREHAKYKAFIGPGNNCLLIKSILKRRFWIDIVANIEEIGLMFCWTQNSI